MPVTIETAAPGRQRWGRVKYRLPHANAAWERRGLLGRLPTHLAMSLDPPLYKGGTIPQALIERETMRRTSGDWEEDWRGWGGDGEGWGGRLPSMPTPIPAPLSLGGQRQGRGGNGALSTPPPGRDASLPGGPWLWAELPCISGKGHPPDLCPPPIIPASPHCVPEALPTTSSLTVATTHPYWTHATSPFPSRSDTASSGTGPHLMALVPTSVPCIHHTCSCLPTSLGTSGWLHAWSGRGPIRVC